MPKRTDIKSILIIGAGPIVIGQACEFDYSGTQACKALKAEGYRIILVNSNPATIMTDPDLADATYIEPITPDVVAKIIEKERPDALLPTMGGQTALNTALALERMGVLEKFGVEMIGARAEAIDKAEDRKLFREAMDRIGLESPRAAIASSPPIRDENGHIVRYDTAAGFAEAMRLLDQIGLPAIIRPAFTLGGTGGGVAYNREEFELIARSGIDASPVGQILIDESLLGWKEYEMEVVRDKADNCIIICSIENVDPMGVHTGDSITVAPALTLTDKEYQIMRNASLAVLREIGVETGGSNVQFAVNPDDGRLVVIEMNPRVSRSSALASKATGFPIAKVAAKLAVGYTLDELANDITDGATPASFEPTIDYVVTKIPRFAFEKFAGSDATLTTAMKSVGEVMAIGRTFAESVQKALRSMETGLSGFDDIQLEGLGSGDDKNVIRAAVSKPTPDRLLKVAQALRLGFDVEQVFESCRIDPWFLEQIKEIVDQEERVKAHGLPNSAEQLRNLKAMGFADARLAALAGITEKEVRAHRAALDVRPAFKRIDTCAAEFAAPTAYMYSTYERGLDGAPTCEAKPSNKQKIIILGGGPNRIGQGIEFDYCCCHACFALTAAGFETIMINCNPETVSTDYDTSDRLYFEPLTAEDVLEIVNKEQSNGTLKGVIVQFGGQTPLKLAAALEEAGVPILGTSPDAIDLAEDRDRFKELIENLGLRQPNSGIARSPSEARAIADGVGYPVVIRPSYVLGGRAMEIVHDGAEVDRYVARLSATLDRPSELVVSDKRPLLIDRYLTDAVEVDVDCLADGKDTFVAGIMEHIEEAGIHSGDSACSLPPYTLGPDMLAELDRQTRELALALKVVGLMNVQFAIKDGVVFVLEVNPRASRTVPFVAKVIGKPIAAIAAQVMAGTPLADFKLTTPSLKHVAVKEAVFPFARFPGVDPILGPEMRSTGEVMGIDTDFAMAFYKSQLGSGLKLPMQGTVFISVKDTDKDRMVAPIRDLEAMGFKIIATRGTKRHLEANGIQCEAINKVLEGRPHIVDAMKNGDVALVFNTTAGAKALADSKDIRRSALLNHIPYYTTVAGAVAVTRAIKALKAGTLQVAPLQSFVADPS
ncbi:Carbamoyl-phosphate synthase large chain [Hyphomicrobium sulfonivorans]|uniref:Carbamoyl phosphate synthase large chain n=1 Tax=Hyphomicrobium sulfonivorans TaxID=121290 RepID=A0A120CTF8_HYPSL|nr:carbamoyl-phosphate synthase large subunit [Hyphomicrobium sulfonivorans]KWT64558.1 Carbamoyl-phosphate synthase large chain [Hyphomicrobium sulfonivorans]